MDGMRRGVYGVVYTLVGLVDVLVYTLVPLLCVHRCSVRRVRLVVWWMLWAYCMLVDFFNLVFASVRMYCHSSRLEAGTERSTSPVGDGV